jgi:hypothetical protein
LIWLSLQTIFAKQGRAGRIFMHSFKPAALGHGRNAGLVLFAVLFLFVSLYSETAFSASLIVTIKQINPEGGIQQVTCVARQKCVLPLLIQTHQAQQETLNLTLGFVPGSLFAVFQTAKGYLYADDKGDTNGAYNAIWHKGVPIDKPSTYDITLFLPAMPQVGVASILGVAHEAALHVIHAPVADLEITTQPVP